MAKADAVVAARTDRHMLDIGDASNSSVRQERHASGTIPSRSVLVANPTLLYSHQLALALHEADLLKAFWCGVPVAAPEERLPPWMPEKYRRKVRRLGIPAELRVHPLRFQLCLRGGQAMLPARVLGPSGDYAHRIFHWFDAWTAKRIAQLKPKVVIAYENSAYHTFAAAKAVGARCVLDAASFHHQTSFDLLPGRRSSFGVEVNRRKDVEAEMADLILTCSPLAAESYVEHGMPASKVHPLLLGAELPGAMPARAPRSGPPRFIFAGALSRRKSVDLILSAFKRLAAEGLAFELQFVGGVADASLLDQIRETPAASHHAGVAQQDLYPMMAQADCLLLPSRFDSFGMVVAEAMLCGTPALVSTRTGAKAMIEQAPGSGWIVEPDGEALYAQLRQLLLDPAQLQAARAHAERAAQSYTWQAYRRRATKLLTEAL